VAVFTFTYVLAAWGGGGEGGGNSGKPRCGMNIETSHLSKAWTHSYLNLQWSNHINQ
jgi:hypothetical protein